MTFMKPTHTMISRLTAWGLVVTSLGVSLAVAQPPAAKPAPAPAATGPGSAEDYNRAVAFIYGNVPVTRRDLGEFVIARGGADKLELLINRTIIETEAKRLNISVTDQEMEAAFQTDLQGLSDTGVKKSDFVSMVLPKYGKTLYEWMEDVIRPRLLLTKMIAPSIKVNEAEVQVQFEREYGEKRQVQIIVWPKGDDLKSIQASYVKIRGSQAEFDSAARNMANASLAASAGHIKPISRYMLHATDKTIEKVAFELKPGEISQILESEQGYVVMKLHGIIEPKKDVNVEKEKARLEKQAFDEKLAAAIPEHFKKLKDAAAPKIYLDLLRANKWGNDPAAIDEAKPNVMPAAGATPPKAPVK